MQIKDVMSQNVELASPTQTIRQVALSMAKLDAGALPVAEKDHLVGMITDRDIAIRAVATGHGPNTPVRDVMTKEVKYCFDDEDIEDVALNMGDIKVRRLPVLSREKRLVGIVALGDIARVNGPSPAGDALCSISEPGGDHSQSHDGAAAGR
jgi:CBS domain-containing protein